LQGFRGEGDRIDYRRIIVQLYIELSIGGMGNRQKVAGKALGNLDGVSELRIA
jgi:hypothetical protein